MTASDRTIVLAGEDGGVERFVVLSESGKKGRPADAKRYGQPYVIVFQEALARAATDRGLKWSHYRVLLAHLSRATYERPVWLSEPAVVGEMLGIQPDEVSRITGQLVARGYLERPKPGQLALNPAIAWRGPVGAREEALAERRKS